MEKNKKLMKTVDKLTRQVDEAKSVIQALKAESVENKQLKVGRRLLKGYSITRRWQMMK